MLDKFLKELVILISGLGSEKIVDVLFRKKNVNEFLIAKKLDITINQARNILYKLADEGLVVFTRKKDKKSGGWYTYFWTLDEFKSMLNYRDRISREVEEIGNQLVSKKSKQFYICDSCGMEVSEENALVYDFTCPECGVVFHLKDNTNNISNLEKSCIELKDKLELIKVEIAILRKKDEAAKSRKLAKEVKLKAEKRKAAKKKTAKKKTIKKVRKSVKKIEMKKINRKKGKKVVKKKRKVKIVKKKIVRKKPKRKIVKKVKKIAKKISKKKKK